MKAAASPKERKKERNINTIDQASAGISTHVLAVETSGTSSQHSDILERLLHRQAVYGRSGQITAIELTPRIRLAYPDPQAPGQQLRQCDDTTLIAALCALTEDGRQPRYPLLANLDAASLDAKEIDFLPRQPIILALDIRADMLPTVLPLIRKRQREGFRLIVNYRYGTQLPAPVVELIKEARLDVGTLNAAELDITARSLRTLGLHKLIATRIGCQETLDWCNKLKFDEFQGAYCDSMHARTPAPTEISRLRLLDIIDRVIARRDLTEIASLVKTDARLSYQLIGYANTLADRNVAINSVSQAVLCFKHDDLYRWLTLLLHTSREPSAATLDTLRRALSRALLLDSLARKSLQQIDPEAAYLIGLFSLTDQLTRQPIEQAISRLTLTAEIKTAVIERKGSGGLLLQLALAAENADQGALEALAARCLISSVDVNLAMINALVLTETTPL